MGAGKMNRPNDQALVKVFHTEDLALLSVVKGLLDSAGVRYELQGEHSHGMIPLSPANGFLKPSSLASAFASAPKMLKKSRSSSPTPSAGWSPD